MLVRVAIDLALDRYFTYEVPAALQEKLAIGQLLSVPFGHREARGFAMEVPHGGDTSQDARLETRDDFRLTSQVSRPSLRLKPVTAIVDEVPFFSPALLELVKSVAAYTASPVESVLKAALPAAVLKRNAHAKEQLFVEPAEDEDGRHKTRDEGKDARRETLDGGKDARRETRDGVGRAGLTARQRWLYEQIVRLGGGWLRPLCQELKTTPASLRALAALELVTVAPRAKRRDPLAGGRILPTKPLPLNAEQEAALRVIEGGKDARRETQDAGGLSSVVSRPRPVLLYGVTGSGKTEVYLQAIAAELAAGRGAIVMVPEIALTPQTVRRFASRFGNRVAVLHSALSDGERFDEWHRIRSGEAQVVIGPRSVVWAPVRNLGLLVVDEEHEASYKQDETPRYHARDVAVLRGALEGAKVVLGSATPSLESWMNVRRGKYVLAEMKSRAGAGSLPAVRLVEMKDGSIFSPELLDALRLRLERGEQSILFLNRRGYSCSAVCASCGFVAECPDCGIPYTYHQADTCLRCHVCGGWAPVPAKCPSCGFPSLDFRGVGTQRAEAALQKCFQRARILRMDADSVSRKNSHDDILSAFRRGEADVLLGTQMIAKGLDFPNVTLVGVLNADASLNLPDFRAAERTYQLLAQVAGRAGRAELPGEVIVQSHDTASPVLEAVVRNDFDGFAAGELTAREACFFPPFSHLAVIGLRSKDLKLVGDWATMYATSLAKYAAALGKSRPDMRFEAGEATPAALEKADGWYRWQIVVRAASASAVAKAWRWLVAERPAPSALRVSVDIDAFSVL